MNLIPLHDGRLGLRSQLSVTISSPTLGGTSSRLPDGSSAIASAKAEASAKAGESQSSSPAPILDFVASDESIDRYGEIISAAGWSLDHYRRNPVFQNAHQYGDILHTLGKALITEIRSPSLGGTSSASPHLFQRIHFAVDVNPVARIAYGLYRGQFLNAVSVGFIPLRWQDADSLSPVGQASSPASAEGVSPSATRANCHRRHLQQELLEVSAVAIPANPNALALGLKSGALVKSDLQDTLDLLRSVVASAPTPGGTNSCESPSSSVHLSGHETPVVATSPLPALTPELFQLARELRRILRRA